MIYIVCPLALLEIREEQDWDRMTDAVINGTVTFPDGVKKDLCKFYPTRRATQWAKLSVTNAKLNRVSWESIEEAQDRCEEILDPFSEDESANLLILALAIQLISEGHAVTVATADSASTPIRTCLADACRGEAIPTVDVIGLLNAL